MLLKTNLNYIDICYGMSGEDIKAIYGCIKQSRSILYSCELINRSSSKAIVEIAYKTLNRKKPKIVWTQGFNATKDWLEKYYSQQISCEEYQQLYMYFTALVFNGELADNSFRQLAGINLLFAKESNTYCNIYQFAYQLLDRIVDYWMFRLIDAELELVSNAAERYWIDVVHKKYDKKSWQILSKLTQECQFLIPFSELCIVIERPISLYLNNEGLPHAEDRVAISFGDGSQVYCHHGIPFPAMYGGVPINNWKPEWIESEYTDEYRSILIYAIGYQRFRCEYPEYDFWQEYDRLLSESIDIVINWQLYHYGRFYLKYPPTEDLRMSDRDAEKITDSLPFQLPLELSSLYRYYNGGYELIPYLYFYPLKQAIQSLSSLTWLRTDKGYPFPLFKGDNGEVYYVLADDPQHTHSPVYCQFPNGETIVYAECVTSLIIAIAQCYQEGAYYIAVNEEMGEKKIEQNLDKVELIFEKFNPDQIDNWRRIWKS
jgi:hypothetical protein